MLNNNLTDIKKSWEGILSNDIKDLVDSMNSVNTHFKDDYNAEVFWCTKYPYIKKFTFYLGIWVYEIIVSNDDTRIINILKYDNYKTGYNEIPITFNQFKTAAKKAIIEDMGWLV